MAKRLSQKVVETTDTFQRLRATLGKCTKSDLVALLVELAQADHGVLRQLDARFELNTPPHELVAATRRAITVATAFDERYANYNFHYDHAAYEEVKRNLTRLIKLKQLRPAMELSLELMAKGSQQVEMSDEGLMTDEIEECLMVVVSALTECDLPADEKLAWCAAMTTRDGVGFICDEEIKSLQTSIKATCPQSIAPPSIALRRPSSRAPGPRRSKILRNCRKDTIGLNTPSGMATIDTGNYTVTMSGALSGPGALIKVGSGTLILDGTNTYTGGTAILEGTLLLNRASALMAGSSLTIGSSSLPSAVFSPITAPQSSFAAPQLAPVPEPGTLTLLAVAALAGLRIRESNRGTKAGRNKRGSYLFYSA